MTEGDKRYFIRSYALLDTFALQNEVPIKIYLSAKKDKFVIYHQYKKQSWSDTETEKAFKNVQGYDICTSLATREPNDKFLEIVWPVKETSQFYKHMVTK